ncbi:MAG: subtype A tannase, partial [Olsenella sp.]
DRVFTFGCSSAGALSALVGATGDSALYSAYLESIGAIFSNDDGESISDSIAGAMCWCPDTALDEADEAYEWMMGQYASEGARADGTFTKLLSDDLSDAFVSYVNSIGLTADGETLNLCEGGEGDYTSGSYYDHLQSVIEGSLDDFLADTTFPFTTSVAAGDSRRTSRASTTAPSSHGGTAGSVTFETAADYVASLNDDERWVSYDASTNTATITSIGAFVRRCRPASKDVGAFDALDRSQTENQLFCDSSSSARHFDRTMSQLLADHEKKYASCSDFSPAYVQDFSSDLATTDELGVSMSTRVNMYNPLYFLLDSYVGYGTSRVAASWRIRSGIYQSDTSLTTEVNLALALAMGDKNVDFATVWAQENGMAERSGDGTTNLIQWIASCV